MLGRLRRQRLLTTRRQRVPREGTRTGLSAKPVRLFTGNTGTNTDIIARLIAQKLTKSMGQQLS